MNVVLFCHSLFSDWNHGNAHFLRGVVAELQDRSHNVTVYERHDGWSRTNLVADHGEEAITAAQEAFPNLRSTFYDPALVDVARLVKSADLVIVHEWNEPSLVAALGRERVRGGFRLLFHDTHHRLVTQPDEMRRYDLRHFDGVLAFGNVLRDLYLEKGLARRAWTWHEAADTRVFYPRTAAVEGDLVWVGNWGDGERTSELDEFLVRPV